MFTSILKVVQSPPKVLDPGYNLKFHLICFNIYCTSACILKKVKNNYNLTYLLRNYFMIKFPKSMGPGQERAHNPWIIDLQSDSID